MRPSKNRPPPKSSTLLSSIEKLESKSNVKTILDTTVEKLVGQNVLEAIVVKNTKTGEQTELKLDGMFVAIGLVPQNEAFADVISLDERGYVSSNETCITNVNGIFVAGDCRTKTIRQVVTASADGATAALAACDYIDNL